MKTLTVMMILLVGGCCGHSGIAERAIKENQKFLKYGGEIATVASANIALWSEVK